MIRTPARRYSQLDVAFLEPDSVDEADAAASILERSAASAESVDQANATFTVQEERSAGHLLNLPVVGCYKRPLRRESRVGRRLGSASVEDENPYFLDRTGSTVINPSLLGNTSINASTQEQASESAVNEDDKDGEFTFLSDWEYDQLDEAAKQVYRKRYIAAMHASVASSLPVSEQGKRDADFATVFYGPRPKKAGDEEKEVARYRCLLTGRTGPFHFRPVSNRFCRTTHGYLTVPDNCKFNPLNCYNY